MLVNQHEASQIISGKIVLIAHAWHRSVSFLAEVLSVAQSSQQQRNSVVLL